MNLFHDTLSMTVQASAACEAYDLIGFNGAKITAADAPVLGVAKHPVTVVGDQVALIVIGAVQVKAAGPITAGAKVVSAAAGGVSAAGATPANPIGVAVNAAAPGELVMILLR